MLQDFLKHSKGKTLSAQYLYGGADPKYRIKARVCTNTPGIRCSSANS
jgi:phosphoenolpyruvate carboxykinase (ATP)